MNEKIIRFLQHQTCATICLLDEMGSPYCLTASMRSIMSKAFYILNRRLIRTIAG